MIQYRASHHRTGVESAQTGMAELDLLQQQLDRLRVSLCESDEIATPSENDPEAITRLVRAILKARRRRDQVFGGELFGEPAWDLLLELYIGEITQRRVSVTSACIASAVPATTGLRWIRKLETDGWLKREDDPLDKRRCWLSLTERGISAMHNYIQASGLLDLLNVTDRGLVSKRRAKANKS